MDQLIEFTGNNPLLVIGTIAIGLAILFYELRLKTSGLTAVTAPQAVRLINQGAKVVDVRDEKDFAGGHIVDAIRIPPAELREGNDIRQLKTKKSILVVCETGSKSGQCVGPLKAAGFETTFSLRGGMSAWRQENLPVISSESES